VITRREALRHSPTLWGMLTTGTATLLLVAGWNAWEYRHELGTLAGRLLRP
jgi:hypothetical protein